MLYIVHIGKCGGGSLTIELNKKNIKFALVHCNKPKIKKDFKYIILIRDPINRFISAFNWKMFRCLTEEGKNYQGMNDASKKNIKEVEGYKYWKNINNFAENLYDEKGNVNDAAIELIKNSNHLKFDINFYMEEILPICDKNLCDVIRYEHYKDDINKVFNIESITATSHVYDKRYSTHVSDRGKKNLRHFLEKDYNCFHKLREKNIINDEYYQDILTGKFHQ